MFRFLAIPFLMFAPISALAEVQMMMAERPGCQWCLAWDKEIGPIYPITDEGKSAPLRKVDVTDGIPDDITLARPVVFTPTFVLLVDGTEVNRLEGYPGDDFFWGLIANMLRDGGVQIVDD